MSSNIYPVKSGGIASASSRSYILTGGWVSDSAALLRVAGYAKKGRRKSDSLNKLLDVYSYKLLMSGTNPSRATYVFRLLNLVVHLNKILKVLTLSLGISKVSLLKLLSSCLILKSK